MTFLYHSDTGKFDTSRIKISRRDETLFLIRSIYIQLQYKKFYNFFRET